MIEHDFLLNITLIFTLVSILFLVIIPLKYKSLVAIFAVVINVIATSIIAVHAITGTPIDLVLYAGNFWGNIPLRIDSLSAWFILIINFTSLTGIIYGKGYLKAYSEPSAKITLHFIWFILFHLSMVWVCIIQQGFAFLIAWEIMSLSSMLLVIFDHNNPRTLKAGMNYLVQMHISVVFLTIGFIWVYFQTGSLNFESIGTFFHTNSNIWLFLIFFIGFGLKAGFVPLHSWLPHAHPAAPSHVSGVMSGVIVKLGIYGIIRIISFLQSDYTLLGEIVVSISLFTGLYGIFNAAIHRDFKRMLAYCTIENIGIIGIGIGLGLIGVGTDSNVLFYLGFGGALLHVLNHSLFKSLLFFAAGSVYQQTHTRDMEKLGGLIKIMPKTALLFLIGAIAIGGIPPFNGFVSEFIIYSGLLEGMKSNNISMTSLLVTSFAGLSIIGGISILTFTKSFSAIFLGNEHEKFHHQPHEVSSTMIYPQYVIIAVMLSVSFFPQFYLNPLGDLISNLIPAAAQMDVSPFLTYSQSISHISIYSAIFVLLIILIWGIRAIAIKNKPATINTTWGCGYVAPNNRMQYSGKSFSKPLGKIFNFLLLEKKQFQELKKNEVFPQQRKYASHYLDFFEQRIIGKITNRIVYLANYFLFFQNGRTQSYVLYGIIFIISIILLTILNIL